MIRLDLPTRKLQASFDSSVSVGAGIVISFFDANISGDQTKGGTRLTNVSTGAGTADIDICPAPTMGYVRNIDTLTVTNNDSGTHIVTVKIDESGADYILIKQSLATLKTLAYDHHSGWQVL